MSVQFVGLNLVGVLRIALTAVLEWTERSKSMSEYIKREDVWELTAILHSEYLTKEQEQMLERLDEAIDQLSGVGLVRCEDCAYNDDGWCGAEFMGTRHVEDDDYCSYGEKENE